MSETSRSSARRALVEHHDLSGDSALVVSQILQCARNAFQADTIRDQIIQVKLALLVKLNEAWEIHTEPVGAHDGTL